MIAAKLGEFPSWREVRTYEMQIRGPGVWNINPEQCGVVLNFSLQDRTFFDLYLVIHAI